jgi:hypothetical protein
MTLRMITYEQRVFRFDWNDVQKDESYLSEVWTPVCWEWLFSSRC